VKKNAKLGLLWRSRSFKVIEVGTNRKPVGDFLSVINNWHPISYRFGVMAAYFVKFWTPCVFEPPCGGLGTTYDVHLRFIGKRLVDFLLMLIELFSLVVTAESLRHEVKEFRCCSRLRSYWQGQPLLLTNYAVSCRHDIQSCAHSIVSITWTKLYDVSFSVIFTLLGYVEQRRHPIHHKYCTK